MAMDSAREQSQSHPQEIGSQTLESMVGNSKAQQVKKPRPAEKSLKCPRCESGNTKFCYYNNYSLSQPRYFCKSCRRYWTKGGTLRSVPVGGGCRKNKRSSSSSSNSSRRHNLHPITALNPPSYASTPLHYDPDPPAPGHVGLHDPWMKGGDFGLVEALGGGFLEIPRGFHNLCGGNGNGGSFGMELGMGMGMELGMGMGVLNEEMGLTGFEVDSGGGGDAQETRNGDRWWGLNPWQNVGGEDLYSWHGLLNSPSHVIWMHGEDLKNDI